MILRNLVEQPVVRHHQVRPLAHTDPSLDGNAASPQAFVLFPESERFDYDTVAQETAFSRVEDARWNLVQNEFILAHMDGVTRVGPTLVPSDHMHALGQDVDNLALPLVAPLATQHDRAVTRDSTFRHGVIPRWKGLNGPRTEKKKSPFGGNGLWAVHPLGQARTAGMHRQRQSTLSDASSFDGRGLFGFESRTIEYAGHDLSLVVGQRPERKPWLPSP